MIHSCENCEYWVHEEYSDGHVCCNHASENVANFMEATDCCYEYEPKEKLEKSVIIGMMRDCITEIDRLIGKMEEMLNG